MSPKAVVPLSADNVEKLWRAAAMRNFGIRRGRPLNQSYALELSPDSMLRRFFLRVSFSTVSAKSRRYSQLDAMSELGSGAAIGCTPRRVPWGANEQDPIAFVE